MRRLLLALLALLPSLAHAAPGEVRVRIDTQLGPIVVAVNRRAAPATSANFLRYVDSGRLVGRTFYRAARRKNGSGDGLVQFGIDHHVASSFGTIPHEPTSRTGLLHGDGTLSMARNAPGTAMGDFFVTVGRAAFLDARPGNVGYAAFGRVVAGMPVVRRILAQPTWPGGRSENTIGQSIRKPIRILATRRLP